MNITEQYNNVVNAGGSLVVNTALGRIVQFSDIASPVMTTVSGNDSMSRDEIEQRFAQLMQGYNQSPYNNTPYNPMIGYDSLRHNPDITRSAFGERSTKEENHQLISNKRKLDI